MASRANLVNAHLVKAAHGTAGLCRGLEKTLDEFVIGRSKLDYGVAITAHGSADDPGKVTVRYIQRTSVFDYEWMMIAKTGPAGFNFGAGFAGAQNERDPQLIN
jgi:hypothetical protein